MRSPEASHSDPIPISSKKSNFVHTMKNSHIDPIPISFKKSKFCSYYGKHLGQGLWDNSDELRPGVPAVTAEHRNQSSVCASAATVLKLMRGVRESAARAMTVWDSHCVFRSSPRSQVPVHLSSRDNPACNRPPCTMLANSSPDISFNSRLMLPQSFVRRSWE